ncbi:rhomboid family intramembrane serine protease, partial [candidate division KSB3 bacterium]|nr:rhomboid family intramembrane serine protease [candidate division KSB3 bacterium]MBD3326320.1 rhomboid family intramembrane serine protease [candidate division KSB3 bacterium]
MFIILPLSHERMQAQRFPHITLGILLLNVFLYIVTVLAAPDTYEAVGRAEEQLVSYYLEHLYLDFPEDTYQKLSPRSQQIIQRFEQMGFSETMEDVNQQQAMIDRLASGLQPGEEETIEEDEEALARRRQEEQARLDALVRSFEDAYRNVFYIKYGYIPARGGVLTIFSSIFLHGGFLHLLFNMLFLWLSGCNLEDLWGRVVYPIFYLVGGVFATLAHGMMYPQSTVPLIGASGAIAALMGAFMIRMYDTKIYFVYLIFMFRIMRGRFTAPAYIMLPLWLLQQFWGVMTSGGSEGGVAFWAHIGGFVFGAVIAGLFKISGFEENVLAPTIEKKTAIVDEHFASGVTKLQEGDVDGAIQDLKQAVRNNPNDPNVHSELSKAYAQQGNHKLALREFKRAVLFYLKQGNMDEAVDQYLELEAEWPDLMLDPPQQLKIAAALEQAASQNVNKYADQDEVGDTERDLYAHAASAYRKLIMHYQHTLKTLEHPDVVKALMRYGDLNLSYLEKPQEARKAYQVLLKASNSALSAEQKQHVQANMQQATHAIAQRAKRKKLQQAQKSAQKAVPTSKKPSSPKSNRDIPIQKRLKLVPEQDAPAKYQVTSIAPLEANKVIPFEGGLDLKRLSEKPIRFADIFVICVSQVNEPKRRSGAAGSGRKKRDAAPATFETSEEVIIGDLFLAGQSRPYRIASNRIAYPEFFSQLHASSLDNFRQFIMYIISNIDSVYVDQGTLTFLKTGKPRVFPSQEELGIHQKIFWKQIMGAVRFQCGKCGEVYWIDGLKIPAGGA